MDDSMIIKLFFERSEKAITALSNKYGKLCMNVAFNILQNSEDAEECVNDSYLAVWDKIPPENPNPLVTFVLRIVRNISIQKYKRNTAQKRNDTYTVSLQELEFCLPTNNSVENECDMSYLTSCINDFLNMNDKINRIIFVRRYWFADSFKDIADISGLSEGAVRTRLSRLRNELRKFLDERGINA